MSERWRPKSYPAQSGAEQPEYTTPPPPVERITMIPTAIRAVPDSNAPHRKGRTLIVCLDGTGDQFDSDNSNVVNFVACLKKDDPSQVTYYQSGIGTYDGHGVTSGVSAAVDMAVGSGLGVHIKDAYRFLMANYCEGDRICLLGFSRGAYTVRCLAGMLHKVGLLPAHNSAQVSFAYTFYKDDTANGWLMSAEFKQTFCMDVHVYFVGVWDCVASVGFIPRKLPFSKTPTHSIHYFRHAMALDEHRAKFKVCQWQQQDPNAPPDTIDNTPQALIRAQKDRLLRRLRGVFAPAAELAVNGPGAGDKRSVASSAKSSKEAKEAKAAQEKEEKEKLGSVWAKGDHVNTNVKEVWFTGCHADVGGGAERNEVRHVLSRIPLRWMIRQTFECNTGILFHTGALADVGIDVPSLWPVYQTTTRPVVGPSPEAVEQHAAKTLPPIKARSTALGLKKTKSEIANEEEAVRIDAFVKSEQAGFKPDLLPEQAEDYFDAIANINDQLVMSKPWWILEFWPIKVRIQKEPGVWVKVVSVNMGRHRPIREAEPKMHWTVEKRIAEKGYKIKNNVDANAVWQVST
jgi:uncharacterized protein (DUF2235 family)